VILAVLALAVAVSALSASEQQFTNFISTYEKKYDGVEEFFERFAIFQSNLQFIADHNAGNHSTTMGLNNFADLTFSEFHSKYTGYTPRSSPQSYLRSQNTEKIAVAADDVVDWRAKNIVTPVKNQQQCGSCWAFSATGSLEGAVALKFGKLVSVSEQQLVDCSGSEGNLGCNGGLMDSAFEWWIKNGGACSQADYPYTARDGTCKTTCKNIPETKVTGYVDIKEGDENGLADAVALTPVSVAIEADQVAFQFYKSGIFTAACGTNLDHGVLAVGYDKTPGQNYWIVKNSWGATWGENGYIRLVRGKNQCGISLAASYPKL